MKIGFVVNNIATEQAGYTTTHLAMVASRMGHEAWYISVADLCYGPAEHIHATARQVRDSNHRRSQAYLHDLQSERALREFLDVSELDVLMLRNDPAEEADLIETKPEIAKNLEQKLRDWQQSVLESLTGADYR